MDDQLQVWCDDGGSQMRGYVDVLDMGYVVTSAPVPQWMLLDGSGKPLEWGQEPVYRTIWRGSRECNSLGQEFRPSINWTE